MRIFKHALLGLLTGGVMLQTVSCADVYGGVITVASLVTAGGVVYLVSQVVND